MDREETIKRIQGLVYCLRNSLREEQKEALDIAIKALQAKTDDDLISRKDAISQAQDGVVVKTQGTSIHLCKTRVVTIDRINGLPSADRPSGEWIMQNEELKISDYRCSVCGHYQDDVSNYCPNCGADMGGDEE